MRRLPIYLLLDTSGSMLGEPIEAVKNGLQLLITSLRQDPYALETACISVITFAGTAVQTVPLTELAQFTPPEIHAQGLTSLGAALSLLAQCIQREVRLATAESKGDWKPVVFILSDGAATDDLNAGLQAIKNLRLGTIVCCAAGRDADHSELKRISESVVNLDTADSHSIRSFFQWVSSSIAVSSQKIEQSRKEVGGLGDLPPPPPEVNIVL